MCRSRTYPFHKKRSCIILPRSIRIWFGPSGGVVRGEFCRLGAVKNGRGGGQTVATQHSAFGGTTAARRTTLNHGGSRETAVGRGRFWSRGEGIGAVSLGLRQNRPRGSIR